MKNNKKMKFQNKIVAKSDFWGLLNDDVKYTIAA